MRRIFLPIICMSLLGAAALAALQSASQRHDSQWEYSLISSALHVQLGDSAKAVAQKLKPPWSSLNTNEFVGRYPFSLWVPYTNRSVILEWQSDEQGPHGWPFVLFAVFSDVRRTNLVDALLYNGAPGVSPIVAGPYQRKLLSVKRGDSVADIFRDLGRRDCQYYQAENGKWTVKLTYFGCKGETIIIEADAGTGTVLRVWNGSL